MPGHPMHQLRDFKVTVRHGVDRARTITVAAYSTWDAMFRAGIIVGAEAAGSDQASPKLWAICGVKDPADV